MNEVKLVDVTHVEVGDIVECHRGVYRVLSIQTESAGTVEITLYGNEETNLKLVL